MQQGSEGTRTPTHAEGAGEGLQVGGTATGMEGELPPGWERKVTPEGVPYYLDHNTRTTSWHPPELPGYHDDGFPPAGGVRNEPAGAGHLAGGFSLRPMPAQGGGAVVGGGLGYHDGVLRDLHRRLADRQATYRTVSAIGGVGQSELAVLQAEIAELQAAVGASSGHSPEGIPPQRFGARQQPHAPAVVVDVERLQGKIERSRSSMALLQEMGQPTAALQNDIDQMLAQLHAAGGAMPEPQAELVECPICMDEAPASTMFNWGCEGQHRLCIAEGTGKCALEHVKAAIESGAVPTCPTCVMENPGGDATMERLKLRNLVGPGSPLWTQFKQIEMRGYIERGIGGGGNAGAILVACPGTDCKNFFDVEPAVKFECRCNRDHGGCGTSFCSLCRDTYHRHNTTCEEARQIRAGWLDWVANGRARYAEQLGRDVAQVNAAAQEAAAATLRNLQQDEAWK